MKKMGRFLKWVLFVLLILLACSGIALPIPLYHRDDFEITKEQVEERQEDEPDLFTGDE